MEDLSNDQLIEAYIKSIELQLDINFQLLLINEMSRRKIVTKHLLTHTQDFSYKNKKI